MESTQTFVNCIHDIEDLLTDEQISDICTNGSNDEAVKECYEKLNIKISSRWDVKSYFMEFDFPETILNNQNKMIECLIWVAAWNRYESGME